MNYDRIKELSGQNPKQAKIDEMKADLKALSESYEAAIAAVESGRRIDEGFFNSLKAAFQTAAQLGKSGASAVKDKVKKVTAPVAAIYRDKKAQAELKSLFDQLKGIIDRFDEISNSAPTIFKNDKQVAVEMDYFRKVMLKMIQTLSSRLAIKEGATEIDQIMAVLKEEGILDIIEGNKLEK